MRRAFQRTYAHTYRAKVGIANRGEFKGIREGVFSGFFEPIVQKIKCVCVGIKW